MNARQLMTPLPAVVASSDKIFRAAEVMKYEAVGCLPVVSDFHTRRLVGLLTDRDISVRCTARRHGTGCSVSEHMTPLPLQTVGPGASLTEIVSKMNGARVRRLPVVDSDGSLIGIVSESDLIRKLPERESLVLQQALRTTSPSAVARMRVVLRETALSASMPS